MREYRQLMEQQRAKELRLTIAGLAVVFLCIIIALIARAIFPSDEPEPTIAPTFTAAPATLTAVLAPLPTNTPAPIPTDTPVPTETPLPTPIIQVAPADPQADVVSYDNLTPVQGKKSDPAHPAIHPTGAKATKRLTPSEKKLFDLIVRRFLALFGESATKEHLRADIKHENHILYLRGLRILEQGWMEFYGPYAKTNERELPEISEGESLLLSPVRNLEKHTQPPSRFNPASLLKLLERENLGTKGTRARIVDSIKSRGYTLNDRFELSTLGYALFETLESYIPDILSPELTRYLEKEMDDIQQEVKNRKDVLTRAKVDLLELLENFRSQEEDIGNDLVAGLQRYWKSKEELGTCPKCGEGTLRVIRSSKTGKRFVGCSNYSDGKCDQTFPLPQKGDITPLDKTCPHCGYLMFQVASGRRKWETCINWTECPGRKDDLKALEERRTKKGDNAQEEVKE